MMTAETSNARGDSRPGIDRLWDSQWVNIVNSPEVLEAIGFRDCEEAVNIAVRMTEQKMAENFASALAAALAAQHQEGLADKPCPCREPTTCNHDFRRDEDNGGNCCQLCDEVKP